MDGHQRGWKGLKDSIRIRLSLWLSLAILVVALVAGVFSFVAAFQEANELQDDMLRQVSVLFDRQHLPVPHLGDSGRLPNSDEEARVVVQYLAPGTGKSGGADSGLPLALPATAADGIQTLDINGEPYRVVVRTLPTGERIVVAQETGFRDEIARDGALRTVLPFLILVPILLLIVADLVRKMFMPIAALSEEIDQRGEQELHPLPQEHLPAEIRPFVVAINRLLGRVSESMDAQRRFVADAAHELRSPLTALSLQAERLAGTDMSETARMRLVALRRGIERGRGLLEQMLSLARVQSSTPVPMALVSVRAVYRRVLEDLMPLAQAKDIDIGVDGESDAQVLANEMDLFTIVKNLVDNAIRYTPEGGQVDLSVQTQAGKAILQIKDTGSGVAPEERSRVFDPFYRVLGNEAMGSGLGLTIVRTITDRIGAQICIGYANEQARKGLSVTVLIPGASA
ncbi:ATP-binding protein [Cupriavidus sp. CV2]|uniref:ATP-binding protein n=1 Tax=Cupriavidus ulmosensis TaxID=3065913 RepID=UPI00296B5560|nr:ATP-binding protein [Cupriavidus sp. CV2]MDW3687913.1 ATP-binding protein [Cupriavidus sp. CV2]